MAIYGASCAHLPPALPSRKIVQSFVQPDYPSGHTHNRMEEKMKKFLVLLTALALVCAFTLPAAAQEEKPAEERIAAALDLIEKGPMHWGFYGSARMSTFWEDKFGLDEDTVWDLQGNSRFGAVVKKDNIGGGFEFAVNDGTAGDSGNVGTRKLFGIYDFGAGANC